MPVAGGVPQPVGAGADTGSAAAAAASMVRISGGSAGAAT
jgi:hypothetical protein